MSVTFAYVAHPKAEPKYVYSLICREDDGPLYVKIGTSINPITRFGQINIGNPITPITLAYLEFPTRYKALQVEGNLHLTADKWHHSGEWFKIFASEWGDFQDACREVLVSATPENQKDRYRWQHLSAQQVIEKNCL